MRIFFTRLSNRPVLRQAQEERNLFKNSNSTEDPEVAIGDDTTVKQGFVELSNVNVAEEMVNMIHSMRAFESYQKAMKSIDQMNNEAINQVGSLR